MKWDFLYLFYRLFPLGLISILHSKDTGSENFKKDLLSFDFVPTAKISGFIIKMKIVNSTALADINIILRL